MSAIDDAVKANEDFVRRFTQWYLPRRPARGLAVVSCMDARLHVEQALGLANGEAHIIRNAGATVSEDTLRWFALSHHELGTREIMILGHTECGLRGLDDRELKSRLQRQFGPAEQPANFHGFSNLESCVREQAEKVRSHPWFRRRVTVRGFTYDIKTGALREVGSG